MAQLTLPNPEVPIGECPHCGVKVKIDPIWFQKLREILALINANL